MGGVTPVGQTAAIDPFLTASPSTGLLTGQGEHGLSHPTFKAVVVHELLEQFGIIRGTSRETEVNRADSMAGEVELWAGRLPPVSEIVGQPERVVRRVEHARGTRRAAGRDRTGR